MSWPVVKLSDVAIINPRCPKDIDGSQEVSFLAMASVSEDGRLLHQESRILEETKKGFTYFERNDVIVAKITPCFENGKAAYLDKLNTKVGFGSTEFHVVRPDTEKLDGKYLFYLLWNPKFRHLGERNMSGSAGQKRVPADFLKKHEIPLPPLPEQKRIAAILDKADQLRQKRQQAIGLADDFLRSVFLDMFGDPVTNPKGWEKTSLGNVFKIKHGFAFKSDFFTSSGEYVLLTPGNFFEEGGYRDRGAKQKFYSGEIPSDYILRKGDLLVAMTEQAAGLLGSSILVPESEKFLHNQRLGLVETTKIDTNKVFLAHLFNQHSIRQAIHSQATGIKVRHTSPTKIEAIEAGIPPVEMQNKFEEIVRGVANTKSFCDDFTSEISQLFNSLSQKAFAGEL